MSSEAAGTAVIRAVDIAKIFDDGAVQALNGVTLHVELGEFVAITGPSGCGKSTLLHLLAALDTPTSGSIAVNGRDLRSHRDPDRYRREEIGLVFQLHNLLPHLNALQNVEISMFSNGKAHPRQRQRAAELLAAVELSNKAQVKAPKLSGGERQRLAVARALANEPAILLADEPTGSLDSASVQNLLGLLGRVRKARGLTILLVTHDSSVAEAADRVIRMVDGRVVDTSPGAAARLATVPRPRDV
ncbi:MAG: ABC transporter ATP-binding protein [Chloroflexi bacterium]|nr:ABC transporter ATP-binding protein [Chloroflexota bacterium]